MQKKLGVWTPPIRSKLKKTNLKFWRCLKLNIAIYYKICISLVLNGRLIRNGCNPQIIIKITTLRSVPIIGALWIIIIKNVINLNPSNTIRTMNFLVVSWECEENSYNNCNCIRMILTITNKLIQSHFWTWCVLNYVNYRATILCISIIKWNGFRRIKSYIILL